MARRAPKLAEIVAAKFQKAVDEILATGDADTISLALDQFRETQELLRRVMTDGVAPAVEGDADPQSRDLRVAGPASSRQ